MPYTIVISNVPVRLLHRIARRVGKWNRKHPDQQVLLDWRTEDE